MKSSLLKISMWGSLLAAGLLFAARWFMPPIASNTASIFLILVFCVLAIVTLFHE